MRKARVLNAIERCALGSRLAGLTDIQVCTAVEAAVSSAKHFECYPERGEFWESIKGTDALVQLIIAGTKQFRELYEKCGRASNKYTLFYKEWMVYMLTHTSQQPSEESSQLWTQLADCHSQPVSDDTRKVMLCEILHAVQNHLQKELVTELESSQDSASDTTTAVSDDIALFIHC